MSRRRYVWDAGAGCLVEVTPDYVGQRRNEGRKSEAEVFGNLQATDGTDVSTRKRHREYMKSHGLALADDFKGEWAKAEQEKTRLGTPGSGHDAAERAEQLGRAMHEARRRARR